MSEQLPLPLAIPRQSELLGPLLATVRDLGGDAPAAKVIDELAHRLHIPEEVQNDRRQIDCGRWGKRLRSPWRHQIHRVRMNAVYAGLIKTGKHGYWTLTDSGRDGLANCRPGIILTVYETPTGEVVWADAITAAGALEKNSVNLFFSSLPYPYIQRGYGRFTEAEIIELTVRCARLWRDALRNDGSIVLNFKDVFRPKAETGGCVRSLYQEKILLALCEDLGFFFADRFAWINRSHLPDNSWVTVRKVRTNMDHENLFWLSKSPNPKADNRNVLVDAAPSTVATYLRKARRQAVATVGPSGHNTLFEEQVAAVEAGQKLKVIPRNALEIPNSDTHRALRETLRDLNLPRHDAMMPVALARHFIRFLTEPGDLVADNFHGSGTTMLACEQENRRYVGSDLSLAHILASAPRMKGVTYHPLLAA